MDIAGAWSFSTKTNVNDLFSEVQLPIGSEDEAGDSVDWGVGSGDKFGLPGQPEAALQLVPAIRAESGFIG